MAPASRWRCRGWNRWPWALLPLVRSTLRHKILLVSKVSVIALAALMLPKPEIVQGAVMYPLVLGGFAIIASIIGAFFVKTSDGKNIMGALYRGLIVAGVLALIASFFGLSGLYVLLEAPFVAVVQIIIYAGAILVLFVFVVMMLNLGEAAAAQEH